MSEQDVLDRHIHDGDLSRSEAGYFCNVCPAPLGLQPLPHLQGAQHKNAIFFLTLNQPEKYQSRYREIPQQTRTALEDGVLVAKEKKVVCSVCEIPLSKEKTVNDHILSSAHISKAASTANQAVAPPPTSFREPTLSPRSSGITNDGPGQTTGADRHIKMIEANGIVGYQCAVCEGTKMITGEVPLQQHLDGKIHKKNVVKNELRLQQSSDCAQPVQPQSPPSRRDEQFSVQRSSSVNQPQSPQEYQHQARPPQNQFTYAQNAPNQLNQLTEQRFKQQQYNILNAFPSLTLNVSIGGAQSSPLPTYQQPTFQQGHQNPRPPPLTGASRGHTRAPYKITSSPRGIVVIFNYYFTGQGELQRDGALQDYANLFEVFTDLGYEVWPQNFEFTKQQTLDKLDEVRSSQKLSEVDGFIAFFLSHGANSPDAFHSADGRVITVEEIIYSKFTDEECPQLQNKPKLFFFNFCRGRTNQLQNDGNWTPNTLFAKAPRDVAVIQAALPHFAAKRHEVNGTVFVTCLCEVLPRRARSCDLHDIILETSNLMQESGATTANPWYIDFGKFFFI